MSTSLEKTEPKKPLTIREQISDDYFKQQIAVALPKHMTPDRFVRVALTALLKTPKLLDCTKESVIECLLNCSALGIEPDGRRAHLIPYGNKCTLIVDYKGLVELAKRSGDVAGVFAQTVCDRDEFNWQNGEVTHRIDWRQDRGSVYAVYSTITFKDGSKQTDVMTQSEVEAIRARSKAGNSGPWVTDWNEMAKKTVFRRASKWITLSPEIADAMDKDGDSFSSLKMDASLTQNKPDFSPTVKADAPADLAARRGRPPKQAGPVVEAEIEPTQPDPQAPPQASAPAPAAPRSVNYVKGLRGLCVLESITEDELFEFGLKQLGWDNSLVSLEEVNMTQPSKLKEAYNNWEAVSKAIKGANQ